MGLAYLLPNPAAHGLYLVSGVYFRKNIDVAELIDSSTLLRVREGCAQSLIVDGTHPVLAVANQTIKGGLL